MLGGWAEWRPPGGRRAGAHDLSRASARKDEAEADYLGVQYMYAAGYDPTGAISIFEKLEALNRTQAGHGVALVLHAPHGRRPHPEHREGDPEDPARAPEYVVTTSEYHDMRQRVFAIEARRKPDEPDNRPHLVKPHDQ